MDRRGRIELSKYKIQERYSSICIIRLEIDCPPHINPNGTITCRNHIHVYMEGYGLSWAYDLPSFTGYNFLNTDNFTHTFSDFCKYCNIELNTNMQGVL